MINILVTFSYLFRFFLILVAIVNLVGIILDQILTFFQHQVYCPHTLFLKVGDILVDQYLYLNKDIKKQLTQYDNLFIGLKID